MATSLVSVCVCDCVGVTIKFTSTLACTHTSAEFSVSFSCQLSQPQFHFCAHKYATKFLHFPTYQTAAGSSSAMVCVCVCVGELGHLECSSPRHAYIYMLMTNPSLPLANEYLCWNYSFNYKTKRECIWYQSKTEATRSSKTLSSHKNEWWECKWMEIRVGKDSLFQPDGTFSWRKVKAFAQLGQKCLH